ncbi:hypothetical protein BSKO_11564 [Bryopsis sp. KO-2023]|nr:hypothetical protein BSKO_11564 [Bryopsis sp. KO-2023]
MGPLRCDTGRPGVDAWTRFLTDECQCQCQCQCSTGAGHSQGIAFRLFLKAGLSFSRVRLETMKESFRCLISLGISQDMYKEMVCRSPFILGQGPQGLREKIDFTTEVMKRKVDEIARWSPYLTYSLERRIMYRAAIKLSTGEDLTGLSLRNFMLQSHVKLCRRYKKDHIDRLTEWWQGLTKQEKWEAVEKQKFMEG